MRPDPSPFPGSGGTPARCGFAVLLALALASAGFGQEAEAVPGYADSSQPAARSPGGNVSPAAGTRDRGLDIFDLEAIEQGVGTLARSCLRWYLRTPPAERMSWGGLFACAGLGLAVLIERVARLRRPKIIPADFTARFLDRLYEGKLDGGKALDYCEMNPSPAARVALAAVRRWGRPAIDLERAVALTHRGEADSLRRNVGTLRRIAALAPLVGLLGTLLAVARVLASMPRAGLATASVPAGLIADPGPAAWASALAGSLSALVMGLTVSTLALVAYDFLIIRIERLSGALDRLGAETIDAIAMATQPAASPLVTLPLGPRTSRSDSPHLAGIPGPAGTVYQAPSRQERASDAVPRNIPTDQTIGF